MADNIRLQAPTVEQQIVINISGEEKLRSFADTLDKISNNKNIQKYWKTQQELINATANAYGNFQKRASKDNATELIKVTNALKAMSGTDLSNILPDFDKISNALTEAQKVAGNIDSAFSVKGFKEAFDSFETLKAYSEDIEKILSHFGVSSNVSELQSNVRLLEEEVSKLTNRLSRAKNANEELRNEFENYKSGSGIADKLNELDDLKYELNAIREQAEETFRQFLELNNISENGYDQYGNYDSNRFSKYFDNIRSGSMTASDAIREFKSEYAYLLEESAKGNNSTFGIEQLETFSDRLDSIFRQVEETSRKINDIISNGVITKSVENLSTDTSLSNSQRSFFENILKDEDSLKNIESIIKKLIEESNNAPKIDLFNEEQLQQILPIFSNIESCLSSLKKTISDVGDGEEFSPLLKMINNVQSEIANLSKSVSDIKLNVNMDLGSEVSERLNQKVAQSTSRQLEAYRKLFSAMKSTGKTNKEMFSFYEPEDTNTSDLIGLYKEMISRAEKQFATTVKVNGRTVKSNAYKDRLGDEYLAYKKEIENATRQLSRAETKRSDSSIFKQLFGGGDLTEVISYLDKIAVKLEEISGTASKFNETFQKGFNVTASVEEIEKLTNRVRELEDELSKIKSTSVNSNVNKSNISSGNSEVENIKKQQQYYKDIANELVGIQDRHEGTHLIINEIGKSESEVVSTIIQENKEIAAGNELWKERQFYIDEYGKVTASYRGDKNEIGIGNAGNISIGNPVKETHIHPYNENGAGSYSIGDVYNMHLAFLQGIRQFELRWRDEVLSIDLTNIDPKSLLSMADSYEDFCAGVQKVMYDVYQIDQDFVFNRGQNLKNSYLANLIQDRGGSAKLYTQNFDGTKTQKDFLDISNAEQVLISTTGLYAIKLSELNEESEEYQRTAQYILNNRKDLAEYYQKMGLITSPDIDNDSLKSQINLINEFANAFNQYISAYEDYYGRMSPDGDGFGLSQSEKTLSELEKLYPELKEVRSNGYVNYPDSELYDKALKKYLNRQEQLQNGLKQTQEQAEQTAKSVQNVSNSPIEDVFQGNNKTTTDASTTAIKEESQVLEQVSTSAKEAATSKEKFANANKEVKVSADASTPSVEEESDALDKVSKRSRSDADNIKLEQRARIYKELNSSLDRYAIVAGRVANGKTLSTDEEEMARLQVRIEELQNEPILSETQLELSRTKLEKIETSLENIQEKLQLKRIDSIQTSIDSYNKDYKSRVNGRPVEENRGKEYQQLLDKYKASIDALQVKKDELAKQPTISESDLDSVKKMTEAVEKNKNALIAMSNAEKGSSEGSRRKEIDKITKYLKDNTRISEEAKTKLKEYLDLLRNGGADVNVDKIHNGFLKVTEAERLAGNEGKRFLDVIRDKAWYGWAAQIASYFSLQDIIRYFKEGATVVKEFDDGLTNISYTMDVTKSQLDGIGQSVLDLSKDLKSSIDNSMQVAKIYANMNTTAEEIKKLSEPTLIMTNLTGFDAATMADDIQAVTQQFEIAAEDSMHIADVYDTVSRNISVDYSKILELTLETM